MQFEKLGPYRLGKMLGQGGMGSVYEGLDTDSGEPAAVKVLSPQLAAEEGFRVRFEAEIESLKKLRHPNIVRLYGYGEEAGTLFYAMELVQGTSLEDELRAGRRFDWREVTQLAVKLCRALKHAHDHGVIHRDLKPANLLLTPDGDVKLSDFGIARLFGNTRLTSDGGVLGTAEYMAPEQADGRTVTDRCDQYSLGGVMYALLAGRPPFRAKSLLEMLQLQRYADPEPVTRFAPQTPAELARIVHQLLEKDPAKRFANALILSRSLEAMERGLSISLSRQDDFVLAAPVAPGPSVSGYSPQAPTLSPTQVAALEQQDGGAVDVTEATVAYAPMAKSAAAAAPRDTSVGRFTKVEAQRETQTAGAGEFLAAMFTPQTLALLAAIGLLGLGGWYFMRAPTADDLFRQIETATADGDIESLRANQDKIASFLARFPGDPRTERLQAVQDELKQPNPVQRAYTEAKRYKLLNPELAAARFRALIDVFDDADGNSGDTTRHYVKLARQQLRHLQRQLDQALEENRKLLAARLTRAGEIAQENPAGARKIRQGIVDLYDDKPWAEDFVHQARTALRQNPPEQAADTPAGVP